MFTVANVGMWVPWHDHTSSKTRSGNPHGAYRRNDVVGLPELIGIRDINNVLDVLPGLQIPLDEDRSEDGSHRRRDQRGQNGGLEKAGHVVDSWVGIR